MTDTTKDILKVQEIISVLSDEMLDLAIDMMQSEQRKRSSEAKELKDDEMRAEAQSDGEQYEKELEESNQI